MKHEDKHSTTDILSQMAQDFLRRDLAQHFTDDRPITGKMISIKGRELTNFGSCSYMGFEVHPALAKGVMEAVQRYGTQFSSSRAFISVNPYLRLEEQLEEIFGQPVIATPTTTLGHFAALPVLLRDNDAVILDLQVHHSVQTSAQLLKARGIPLHIIRHNDMEQLEKKIQQLQNHHRHVWYLADGVYSMFGDFAPMDTLYELMDRYKSFHLYIDDAHGMSWCGKHGCGYVRSERAHHDKMVLSVSLNKAFASSGGCLVFPNREMAQLVRTCGGTMIFSGPIQPPMLGAAIASAELHLSPEMPAMQAELQELIRYTNTRLDELGLPQYQVTESPVYFIPMGLPRIVANMVHRILGEGFYVNMATFPATPMRQGGLRFMLNRNLSKDDVDALLARVQYHYPLALREEGSSYERVAHTFKIAPFSVKPSPDAVKTATTELEATVATESLLEVQRVRSIRELDQAMWDALFAKRGNFTHSGLQLLEDVFAQEDNAPEDQWDFYYFIVRDTNGKIVLATVYSSALVKDDMFTDAKISRQIESMREQDPYYLTSHAVMLGCMMSRGDHLYLDREHPHWKEAMMLLFDAMQKTREEIGASQVMLREFWMGEDEEFKQYMLDQGFIEFHIGDACQVRDLSWEDHDEYLHLLGSKYRYNVRKEILPYEELFEITTVAPWTPQEIQDCYDLYCQVYEGSFALNVFKLPYRFFEAICTHPDYEIIRLFLIDDPRPPLERKPVAAMFSHVKAGTYSALIIGLDYDYVRSHNTYKQALYQTVQRAWQLKCELIDLAFTAVLEKKKVGARPYPTCAYVQAENSYNFAIIESMTLEGTYHT